MPIDLQTWPTELAAHYRAKGYWLDRPLSDILNHGQESGPAVIDGQRVFSYRDLDVLSNRLAAYVQQKGLGPGDTALVQLGNIAELYIVFFALLKAGVAPVNALFSHRSHELDAYVAQLRPKVVIADRQHPLFADDNYLEQLRRRLPELALTALHHEEASELSLARLMEGEPGTFQATPSAADEVAFFNLSGGSTGTPKLIPRTHNDYYYSIRASVEVCRFDQNTRYLCAIPAAHNYPMSSPGALGVFYAGGLVVMAPDPSVTTCFPLIERHRVNVTALVPPAAALWRQWVENNGNAPLRSLELLQIGGARLSPSLAASIPPLFGCRLQQVFGMAEGLVNYTRLDDDDDHIFNTQGRPMSADDEVWVADEQGQPLPPGQIGLLMTRGPYTFRGYYQSPAHNAKSFDVNGFYCSGDLVSMDGDGYLRVHGRQKDQINRGGEKIAAEEIEHLLLRHPAVLEAALVAMEDDMMGEKSCAFMQLREPVKGPQLRRFLREQGVAEYKLPDHFRALERLPLTPVGKIDKKQLRRLLQENNA